MSINTKNVLTVIQTVLQSRKKLLSLNLNQSCSKKISSLNSVVIIQLFVICIIFKYISIFTIHDKIIDVCILLTWDKDSNNGTLETKVFPSVCYSWKYHFSFLIG